GVSERGIVALSFVDNGCEDAALDALRHDWPAAAIRHAPAATEPLVERIFAPTGSKPGGSPLPVYLAGTNFQVKVWRALLAIPPGALVSYGALAAAIGQPKAARAVGTTVGANAISFLIPCHRVIRSTGVTTGYRWGDTRKRAMHVWEAGHFTSS
ncbi:MAG: methylated-DNA--[protein]-cysteine S-methyltransferase, partial [Anaerolineae bacterium]